MAMYTATEKINYLKTWAVSGQTLQDYCKNEGIGRTTMNLWAKIILADDYTSTLRDPGQKQSKRNLVNRIIYIDLYCSLRA